MVPIFLNSKKQNQNQHRKPKKKKNYSQTEYWTHMPKHISEQIDGIINLSTKNIPPFQSACQNLVY